MTDVEVFRKFMDWMGMSVIDEKLLDDGNTVIRFASDYSENAELFTTVGYDEFEAGIIFDPDGNLVKGYMDSHVCESSPNCKLISKLLKQ